MRNRSPPPNGASVKPGAAFKAVRLERGMTLAELSQKTGLQPSTLSKIENGKNETTISNLLRISLALDANVADMFGAPTNPHAAGRTSSVRSITRAGEGKTVDSSNGTYTFQAYELLNKNLTPIVAEVKARSLDEFGPFHRHCGEEVIYVIEGELALYTDTYTPIHLMQGDTAYFDSGMGHAYVAVGPKPCRIFSVFLTPEHTLEIMESTAEPSTPVETLKIVAKTKKAITSAKSPAPPEPAA